jgi:hypothetical protein
VPSCPGGDIDVFRRAPTCSDVLRRAPPCSAVLRRAPTCSDVLRRAPPCSDVLRRAPTCAAKGGRALPSSAEGCRAPPRAAELRRGPPSPGLSWTFHVPRRVLTCIDVMRGGNKKGSSFRCRCRSSHGRKYTRRFSRQGPATGGRERVGGESREGKSTATGSLMKTAAHGGPSLCDRWI